MHGGPDAYVGYCVFRERTPQGTSTTKLWQWVSCHQITSVSPSADVLSLQNNTNHLSFLLSSERHHGDQNTSFYNIYWRNLIQNIISLQMRQCDVTLGSLASISSKPATSMHTMFSPPSGTYFNFVMNTNTYLVTRRWYQTLYSIVHRKYRHATEKNKGKTFKFGRLDAVFLLKTIKHKWGSSSKEMADIIKGFIAISSPIQRFKNVPTRRMRITLRKCLPI